jgi:hypothetical protein
VDAGDEHVLQHAALRVHPVEDRDLGSRPALLDQLRDLGDDEARLGMLVFHLERSHGRALAELGEEVLLLALAVVPDDGVRSLEHGVRRAVVLLERDTRAVVAPNSKDVGMSALRNA